MEPTLKYSVRRIQQVYNFLCCNSSNRIIYLNIWKYMTLFENNLFNVDKIVNLNNRKFS